jgi:hypothetical protein
MSEHLLIGTMRNNPQGEVRVYSESGSLIAGTYCYQVTGSIDAMKAEPVPEPPDMDTALRDAIHETEISRCGQFSDTCPDWPLAHALGAVLRDAGLTLTRQMP